MITRQRTPAEGVLPPGRIEEIEAMSMDPAVSASAREALCDLLAVRVRLLSALRRAFDDTGWCPVCDGHHHPGTPTPCPVREFVPR